MLHAVIMAGGSGTRFWPASRDAAPKQMLPLARPDRSMLQSTVDRLAGTIDNDRVWVVTNDRLVEPIRDQLPDVPADHVIGEPAKRDTAACVGLAAALLAAKDPDAVMAVMPSDHVIEDHEAFGRAVRAAATLIDDDPRRIVTFGIKPSYPAESFGYIERGEGLEGDGSFRVSQFREKPDRETAQRYLDAGTFYWNAGIFFWRADTILEALRQGAPEIAERIDRIAAAIGTSDYQDVLEREFDAIRGVSIDYAVMEGYPNVAVIEAPFDWDDVGSWRAMSRLNDHDADDNAVVGNYLGIDTRGCIIRGQDDHLVVTIDVEDLIVVQTPDATLVAPKHAEERVREVVQRLKESGSERYL